MENRENMMNKIARVCGLALLATASLAMPQTLAVQDLSPVNIQEDWARAISAKVRDASSTLRTTVDRGTGLQNVLQEHALGQAGATNRDDSLGLMSATQLISGSCGAGARDRWFIDLTLVDVQSGEILGTRYATVTSYQNLLKVSGTVTKALLMGTRVEDDGRVTTVTDSAPIIMGTRKVINEIHVYQHGIGTPGKKRFIPCSFCGGRGEVPCGTCPTGMKDCPACTINSKYKGIETHGQYLTGYWVE